jgi:hypothetical protein
VLRKSRLTKNGRPKRAGRPVVLDTDDYRVGPGHPPKEFQFKPGQSGNPKGTRRKKPSVAADLKESFERALNRTLTLNQGDREQIITKAQAGMEQLVNQFAKGDRYARRDVVDLASKYGIDLVAGLGQVIEKALEADVTAQDKALLADYVRRHRDDADLAESKDSETPSPTNSNEKDT